MTDQATRAGARTPETDRLADEWIAGMPRYETGATIRIIQRDAFAAGLAYRPPFDGSPDDRMTASMARAALARRLAWPDFAKSRDLDVDNARVVSWLGGVPKALADAGRDQRIAGLALSLMQDIDGAFADSHIGTGPEWFGTETWESIKRLRDALDAQAAPGQMSATDVAVQEAAASVALDAGIDEIGEKDEITITGLGGYDGAYRLFMRNPDAMLERIMSSIDAQIEDVGGRAEGLDPEVVDALRQSYEAGTVLEISTPDPRFSPTEPLRVNGYVFRPANGDGYVDAFYALADMLEIPAQPLTPREVWDGQMRPRVAEALALISEATPAIRLVNDWAAATDEDLVGHAENAPWFHLIEQKDRPMATDAAVYALSGIRMAARSKLGSWGRFYTTEQASHAASLLACMDATGRGYKPSEMVAQVARALGLTAMGAVQ